VILGYHHKSVSARVAMCTRAVADAFEARWGYHLWLLPLPNDAQLKAYALGGGELDKVNKARIKSGLNPVGRDFNVKLADKNWKGLATGHGMIFRVCHNTSIAFPEFADQDMIELVGEICAEHGKLAEILHNEQYSIFYIYEPAELPQ
jgi:hypothetical protein